MADSILTDGPELRAIMEYLGLPPHTIRFVFEAEVNKIPTVTCEYCPRPGDPETLTEQRPLQFRSEWELP